MGEKTEKATPKKLRDARKKGQVARSQDLPSAFTFITSISLVIGLSGYLYSHVTDFIKTAFNLIPESNLETLLPGVMYHAFTTIFLTVIPILGIVAAIGIIINFLSVGPVFSPEVFKFDIKKFDPVKNLKAKFKLKTLVELVKSLIKVFVAAYLIWGVMYKSLPVLIKAVTLPMSGVAILFYAFLLEVVVKVGIFFIVVAVLDFAYQKYNFGKEMMMEKFEIKQEYKNTEGDPQIKGKRKQIAQEIAYQEGPSAAVQGSKAVVTNPTHLAIGIAYEREVDQAPYVTIMGRDAQAAHIIRLAEKHNVPIVRNVPLAHKLWEEGDVYDYIPEETYEAMAEVLRWVASLEQKDVEEQLEALAKEEEET